jgi:hypothetical protein
MRIGIFEQKMSKMHCGFRFLNIASILRLSVDGNKIIRLAIAGSTHSTNLRVRYTVKKVTHFHVPSRLGTGKTITSFYSVLKQTSIINTGSQAELYRRLFVKSAH